MRRNQPEVEQKESEPLPAVITPSHISVNKSTIIGEMGKDHPLEISISNAFKTGEGMGCYIVYEVTTRTNLPYFREKNFTVSRRTSDFLDLHEILIERHFYSPDQEPPAQEESITAMTKLMVSKDYSESSDEFIQKRREDLECYLSKLSSYPALRMDPDFRNFLENKVDLPPGINASPFTAAGALHSLTRVEDTFRKLIIKMDGSDSWNEGKQHQTFYQELRKLHGSVEALVLHREELSVSTSEFAKREQYNALCRIVSQLAELEKTIGKWRMQQDTHDIFLLFWLVKDYIRLTTIIEVFLK